MTEPLDTVPLESIRPAPQNPRQPPGLEYEILRKMGRCRNGFEADAGQLFHAVLPKSFAAICKAKPGRHSAGWSDKAGLVVTCPRCRKALGLAPLAVERAVEVLTGAGFVPDGATREEEVRIPTSRAPVYGGIGGELRTLGGRTRFAIPGTAIRVTVGASTTCVYRRQGREVEFLGEGNYRTKDFTREVLLSALFPKAAESGAQKAVQLLRAAGVELPELARARVGETP